MLKFSRVNILTLILKKYMITWYVNTERKFYMIALYVRVSSEEQAKKGYSIRNQIDECGKKANGDFIPYIDEGFSGEFLERPGLEKLRKDVREGKIEKVVCYDPDRLSRKLMNQLILDEEFRRKGVEMIYVNGEYANTPEGQLFYSMRGAISEFEKAKIKERMSSGRKRKAKEGKVVKDYHVYGYDYKDGRMIINESEAETVKLMFNLFTKPNDVARGINGIAKHLTSLGIPTKKGAAVWHRQVVRQMLMNGVYTGKFIQNKWNTEGMLANRYKEDKIQMVQRDEKEWIYVDVPSIIDDDTFNHAQDLLEQSRRRWAKKGVRDYLLSGLLRCAKCGNTMTGRNIKNWGKYDLGYSDEKNTAGSKNKGCVNRIKCEDIDEVVWEHILHLINNPDEINSKEDKYTYEFEKAEIQRIESELERIKNGRKRVMKLYTMEGIDETEIMEQLQEMKAKENDLTAKLDQLQKVLSPKNERNTETNLKQATEYYLSNDNIGFEQKKEIIRTMVKEIRVHNKEEIEVYLF